MDLGLRCKIAVVTGGGIGIGLAVAEGLAAEGCDIVIAARDQGRADAAAAHGVRTPTMRAGNIIGICM